jgi:hypothetical protein
MCPDNETPNAGAPQNPTLAEDDKNRRTVEPSSGPNVNGYDDLVKTSHTRPDTTDEGAEPSPSATPHAEHVDETSAQTTAMQPIADHVEPPAQLPTEG